MDSVVLQSKLQELCIYERRELELLSNNPLAIGLLDAKIQEKRSRFGYDVLKFASKFYFTHRDSSFRREDVETGSRSN